MNFFININFPKRKRIRLYEYNYSSDGDYFVTICTKDRQEFFGEIRNGIMGLNEFGCIAAECWQEIPKYFKNVQLYDWVIMPNHVHGILVIDVTKNRNSVGDANMRTMTDNNLYHTDYPTSERDACLRPLHGAERQNDRTKMLLPKIIHGFKSTVTRRINRIQNKIFFQWQRSYYDHIIDNEKSFNNICEYIQNNPINWKSDK